MASLELVGALCIDTKSTVHMNENKILSMNDETIVLV